MAEKITCSLIIEILGRPPEHIVEVLGKIISERIEKEQGIKLISKKIHEPKRIEEAEAEIYTTFTEIDIEADGLINLLKFVFTYMPSHVEIIKPEEFKLKAHDFSGLLNEITRKLHGYDEVVKRLDMEKSILQNQMLAMRGKFQPVNPVKTTEKSSVKTTKARKKTDKKKK